MVAHDRTMVDAARRDMSMAVHMTGRHAMVLNAMPAVGPSILRLRLVSGGGNKGACAQRDQRDGGCANKARDGLHGLISFPWIAMEPH
jgi:hypothetical protein